MFKFTIDRSVWARGDKNQNSLLDSSTGKMCCLGILALACGLKKKDIIDRGAPLDIVGDDDLDFKKIPGKYKFLLNNKDEFDCYDNSEVAEKLMDINDSCKVHGKRREDKLKKIFLENNIEVEFIGTT